MSVLLMRKLADYVDTSGRVLEMQVVVHCRCKQMFNNTAEFTFGQFYRSSWFDLY